MRILITGASGFLGRECVAQFQGHGYEVITTDKVGNVDIQGDLSDFGFVDSLPDADVVVNCAAVQYVTKEIPILLREKFFLRNNVQSAKNLADRYAKSRSHFIHVGTSMMYLQTGQDQYTVDSPMRGEGVYSRSKLAAQQHLNQLPKLATVIPCIIGGKGREGLFAQFVAMILRFNVVAFPGRGMHKVHMVHVVDVASLIVQIAEVGVVGSYNAAAPKPLTIRQWIDEIVDEFGIHPVKVISIPLLPVKLLSQFLFFRPLAREQLLMLEKPHVLSTVETEALGWKPKYTNSQIARDIAVSIRDKANFSGKASGVAIDAEILRPQRKSGHCKVNER